jgi:hypothetical protein
MVQSHGGWPRLCQSAAFARPACAIAEFANFTPLWIASSLISLTPASAREMRLAYCNPARKRRSVMSKLISICSAAALALSAIGLSNAADQSAPTNEQKLQQQKDSAQEPAKQQTTGDLTKEEQAYLSALKKCEPMTGGDKQQCIERTKKQFGH